jgi:hypothetical protein
MTRWLVVIRDGVDPRLEGPFERDRTRVAAAREHRKGDIEKTDGLFRLDISVKGLPRIYPFVSRDVTPELT